jgi:hypothetical protein
MRSPRPRRPRPSEKEVAVAEAFDRDKLRRLAWDRLQRQVRRGDSPSKRGSEAQWFRDVLYIEKMATVVEWCATKGISVVLAKKANGTYEPDSKVITLTSHAAPERMFHYLLHECGHHLIGMEEHHERFGKGYPRGTQPRIVNSFEHRLACLEEEMEAWHRGWKLAKRLDLQADREAFDTTRTQCLKSYVTWTARTRSSKKCSKT